MRKPEKTALVLGACDGLTIVIGLLMSLRHHQSAIFHAAIGAGIAEFVGMGAALWLTAERSMANFGVAMACGIATALACIVPATPYLVTTGGAALLSTVALAAGVGGIITWLRPEKGVLAVTETYGTLALAGTLSYVVSFVKF